MKTKKELKLTLPSEGLKNYLDGSPYSDHGELCVAKFDKKRKEELKKLAQELSQDEFLDLVDFYATSLLKKGDDPMSPEWDRIQSIGAAITQLLINGTKNNIEAMGILEKVKHIWWKTIDQIEDEESAKKAESCLKLKK